MKKFDKRVVFLISSAVIITAGFMSGYYLYDREFKLDGVENILQNQPETTPFVETDNLAEPAKGNEIENNNYLEQGSVDEIGSTNAIDCQTLSRQTSIEEIVPPVQTESTIAPVEEVQTDLNTQPEKTEPTCFNIVN